MRHEKLIVTLLSLLSFLVGMFVGAGSIYVLVANAVRQVFSLS
jgi:hypothetical protein